MAGLVAVGDGTEGGGLGMARWTALGAPRGVYVFSKRATNSKSFVFASEHSAKKCETSEILTFYSIFDGWFADRKRLFSFYFIIFAETVDRSL